MRGRGKEKLELVGYSDSLTWPVMLMIVDSCRLGGVRGRGKEKLELVGYSDSVTWPVMLMIVDSCRLGGVRGRGLVGYSDSDMAG